MTPRGPVYAEMSMMSAHTPVQERNRCAGATASLDDDQKENL